MNDLELQYLRDINRQLASNIKPLVADRMASQLLHCIQHLIGSVIAEQDDARQSQQQALALCHQHLPLLRQLFAKDAGAVALIARMEESCSNESLQAIEVDMARIAARLAKRSDAAAGEILSSFVDFDAQRWLRIDEAALALAPDVASKTDRETEPFTANEKNRFITLLQDQCNEANGLAIARVVAIPGGFSKQTMVVTLSGNRVLPNEIIVRRDRPDSPVNTTVLDEFELLKSLHDAGVAVPKPFAIDNGSIAGHPLMVVSREAGKTIADAYDVFDRGNTLAAPTLARQLARVHAIPLQTLSRPLPGQDQEHLVQLRTEIDGFYAHWQSTGASSIVIETAFEWIYSRCAQFDGERCITHRDLRFHNVLSDEHGVTAIIDWELAATGRPARDLGYLYHQVVQLGDWQAFLAAYEKAGGKVPSGAELDFYILWSDLYVAIYMYMARSGYMATASGNIQFAFAGERMRQHNLRLLSTRMSNFLRKAS